MGGRPQYRAHEADQQAWESALRPKVCLLAIHGKLRKIVASKLVLDLSPEQISGWLKMQYLEDQSMRVSHETIYRSLFIQARGVLKKELIQHLRSQRRIRRSRHSGVGGQSRGQIVDALGKARRNRGPCHSRSWGGRSAWVAPRTVTSPPWWNVIRVLPRWSRCPAKTRLLSWPH
jgi:hypothetical protein